MKTKTKYSRDTLKTSSSAMSFLLKLEEGALMGFAYFLFFRLPLQAWVFWALLLSPDLSMAAYLINTRLGAWLYNLFHHKAFAVLIYVSGFFAGVIWLQAAGLILLAHASMDRVFGYGLKYEDSFFNTHLGKIGKHTQHE
jgi:hypothetical protein